MRTATAGGDAPSATVAIDRMRGLIALNLLLGVVTVAVGAWIG
jgi:uncharacterized membrane protein